MICSPGVEVFDGHRALFRPLVAPAVALGNFDGVHIGHQRLLAAAVAAAGRTGGDAVVFTFEPHPMTVLKPALAPPRITPRDRKLELIAAAGIDVCVVEPFTQDLACLPPEQFLDQILVQTLGAKQVVVGYDFNFGRNAEGTARSLAEYGARAGFAVDIIQPVASEGVVASSTEIRDYAARGVLAGVRLLLGRDLDVDGEVVRGAGRGRSIGIPTANVRVAPEQLLPQPGVYAVTARVLDAPDRAVLGVANLGTNPTFVDEGALSLEVHLLDFDADLYGKRVRVAFIDRIRGERRFSGPDELVAQIHRDIARGRELIAARDQEP